MLRFEFGRVLLLIRVLKLSLQISKIYDHSTVLVLLQLLNWKCELYRARPIKVGVLGLPALDLIVNNLYCIL